MEMEAVEDKEEETGEEGEGLRGQDGGRSGLRPCGGLRTQGRRLAFPAGRGGLTPEPRPGHVGSAHPGWRASRETRNTMLSSVSCLLQSPARPVRAEPPLPSGPLLALMMFSR